MKVTLGPKTFGPKEILCFYGKMVRQGKNLKKKEFGPNVTFIVNLPQTSWPKCD